MTYLSIFFSILLLIQALPSAAVGKGVLEREYYNLSQEDVNERIDRTRENLSRTCRHCVDKNGNLRPGLERRFEKIKNLPNIQDRQKALYHMETIGQLRQNMDELAQRPWGTQRLAYKNMERELVSRFNELKEMGILPQHFDPSKIGHRSRWSHSQRYQTLDPATIEAGKGFVGENPITERMLAKAYQERGAFSEAADAAQKWALMSPEDAEAHVVLGNSLEKMGDYENAYQAGMQALRLDPKNVRAKSLISLTRGRRGRSSPGAAAGESGVPELIQVPSRNFGVAASPALSVDSSQLLKARQWTAEASSLVNHDPERAARKAKRAIELNPTSVQARLAYLNALNKMKRYKEMVRASDAALKVHPNHSMFYAVRASAQNLAGQFSLALQSADLAVQADAKNAEAYFQRAVALDGLGGRIHERNQAVAMARRYAPQNRKYQQVENELPTLGDGELVAWLTGESLPKRSKTSAGVWGDGDNSKRLVLLGLTTVVGGFLIGLGLLRFSKGRWQDLLRKVTLLFSREAPSVSQMPASPFGGGAISDALLRGYTVDREIGNGGMGVVYEGTDRALKRRVAIKKMRDEIRSDERERQRFLSEARMVATMHHPCIVEIFSIVEDGRDAFLIFEFVDGKTVHSVLRKKGSLNFVESLSILRGACAALDYAHGRGVIHRDLKPSNVMISREGHVKVMDFGVARMAKDSLTRVSQTNTVVGTPPYMAPEQEQGTVHKASDVYALGVMLYEMVTGQLPFAGIGAGMLMAKINKTYIPASCAATGLPEGFDAVMERVFEPDPSKRFQSAGEFLRALEVLASPTQV